MTELVSGIAGEDIEDGEVVAGLTADGRLYAKPPTDWTGPIINTHEYGKPMSGEMVYYPRPEHPLEEENKRLRKALQDIANREHDYNCHTDPEMENDCVVCFAAGVLEAKE